MNIPLETKIGAQRGRLFVNKPRYSARRSRRSSFDDGDTVSSRIPSYSSTYLISYEFKLKNWNVKSRY